MYDNAEYQIIVFSGQIEEKPFFMNGMFKSSNKQIMQIHMTGVDFDGTRNK